MSVKFIANGLTMVIDFCGEIDTSSTHTQQKHNTQHWAIDRSSKVGRSPIALG